MKVAALIIDPANKKMFYCLNHEHEAVVWSASLYGHHPTDLGELGTCTGLAVDSYRRRLFVGDAAQILQMDYDGGNRTTILHNHPHLNTLKGLMLFEDHLYFIMNGSYRLHRCAIFGDRTCEPYISRNLNPDAWLIEHQTTQREDVENTCKNVACDGVCALGEDKPLCVCPDGALQLANVCYNFDVKQANLLVTVSLFSNLLLQSANLLFLSAGLFQIVFSNLPIQSTFLSVGLFQNLLLQAINLLLLSTNLLSDRHEQGTQIDCRNCRDGQVDLQLPLFNGVRGRSRMDGLAIGLAVGAALVALVVTVGWFIRRYCLRTRGADAFMP
ncbi:Vitellogenin receptor [Eumeta japonica]|uniref:Vitellogenin receptor n=1 Tax=Eumeta variegata TaxID=151549 RepID=A0A4C1WUH4_EUMVA|nr:Vitellogenin receptor [Eumeta japonica]